MRTLFVSPEFPQPLLDGLNANLTAGIDERIRRLGELIQKTTETDADSRDASNPQRENRDELAKRWPAVENTFQAGRKLTGDSGQRDAFLQAVSDKIGQRGKDYLTVIKGLKPKDAQRGNRWLQGIVDQVVAETMRILIPET